MIVPPGFNTVAPYLFVRDAAACVAFLARGLGGEPVGTSRRPDGMIANAQLRFGTSTIMVSEASDAYPPGAVSLYLFVDDADAAVARAVEHGATLEMPVGDMPYGDRQGGVRDAWNTIWWLSRRLTPAAYSFDDSHPPLPGEPT